MAKNKTAETEIDVMDFVNAYVDNEQKKADSFSLIELMQEWSGFEPKMWGPTIIGFGNYHYKYASGHQGDAPLLGFSPQKQSFRFMFFLQQKKVKDFWTTLANLKWVKPASM